MLETDFFDEPWYPMALYNRDPSNRIPKFAEGESVPTVRLEGASPINLKVEGVSVIIPSSDGESSLGK